MRAKRLQLTREANRLQAELQSRASSSSSLSGRDSVNGATAAGASRPQAALPQPPLQSSASSSTRESTEEPKLPHQAPARGKWR